MNDHYENIHRYDFLTKDILEQEYLINGLSDAEIAKKFNMPSKAVVWRKRKKFGIANRYSAKSNKHATKNRKHNITKEKAIKLLESGSTFKDISKYMGCSVVVAKRRFKELGLCKTQENADQYIYWDIELTPSQKQMIIGSTAGDGTIARQGAYSCSHSLKQLAYHKHKRQMLSDIHSGKFQHAVHKRKNIQGKPHESYHFTTGCNRFCHNLRTIFYPNGKKICPYPYLLEKLEAEGLAYWYMDDGSCHSRSSALHTYGYSALEQILIQSLLKTKFGLESKIRYRKERNDYYQQFSVAETIKFLKIVKPYIIPSMQYKLGNARHRQKV